MKNIKKISCLFLISLILFTGCTDGNSTNSMPDATSDSTTNITQEGDATANGGATTTSMESGASSMKENTTTNHSSGVSATKKTDARGILELLTPGVTRIKLEHSGLSDLSPVYIIENRTTIRAAAKVFGVSKSTVHKDLTQRLKRCDKGLYLQVKEILEINKAERHIRGGMATREKYRK